MIFSKMASDKNQGVLTAEKTIGCSLEPPKGSTSTWCFERMFTAERCFISNC